MYDETNVPGPEYRVRTVIRHIVTRYCHPYKDSRIVEVGPIDGVMPGGSVVVGEFPNEMRAFEVAHALSLTDPGSTVST
jgi:hypothetical protein